LNRRTKWQYGNVENADMRKKVVANPGSAPSAAKPVLSPKKKIQVVTAADAVVPASSGGKGERNGGM